MGHILSKVIPFFVSVFAHWQIWLSGGGLGGVIVITATLIERFTNWKLSKRQHVYLFLIAFFLCSCFLSWVDKDDALHGSQQDLASQIGIDQNALTLAHSQYGDLKAECFYQKGVVDTLHKQNGDQQNTINNCQTQALKLMQPQPLKWVAMALDKVLEGGSTKSKWLLLTNKPVTPVDLIIDCGRTITEIDARIVAIPTLSQSARLSDTKWETKISAPTWDSINPVSIDTTTLGRLCTSSATTA